MATRLLALVLQLTFQDRVSSAIVSESAADIDPRRESQLLHSSRHGCCTTLAIGTPALFPAVVNMVTLLDLPILVLDLILAELSQFDLERCSTVCSTLRDSLWTEKKTKMNINYI